MNELLHLAARHFKSIGGYLTQMMHTTMHVTIHIGIVIRNRLYDLNRFLGSRAIIQIYQRLIVYLSTQYWKICANFIYMKWFQMFPLFLISNKVTISTRKSLV